MKNKLKMTVIALGLAIAATTTNSYANDGIIKVLSAGNEIQFNDFMHTKGRKIITRNENEWNSLARTITLYNISPIEFLNISNEKKNEFFANADLIESKLTKLGTPEALEWAKYIKSSKLVYQFVWNNYESNPSADLNIEIPKI